MIVPVNAAFDTSTSIIDLTATLPVGFKTGGQQLSIPGLHLTCLSTTPDAVALSYDDDGAGTNAVVLFPTASTAVNGGGVMRYFLGNGLFVPNGKHLTLTLLSGNPAATVTILGDLDTLVH